MAPRPAQQFSPIHNTTVQYRRQEYDDFEDGYSFDEAANDNERQYANDNNVPGPLTDIASNFNQQSYQQSPFRQQQPTQRQSRRSGTASRAAGKAAKSAGKAAEASGRAMQRGGGAMVRGGAALSSTGLGAIIGVPLMVAGGATTAAGTGVNAAGKVSKAAGRAAERSGKRQRRNGRFERNEPRSFSQKLSEFKDVKKLKKTVKKYSSVTRINLTTLSVATPIWFTLQLPLALAAMFALGLAGVTDAVAQEITGSPVLSFLSSAFDTVTNGIESVTGVNLNVFELWADFAQVVFGGLTLLVFMIGIATLFCMAIMYTLSGIRCFNGEHTGLKTSLFIFAILGYLMPILNLFPWFMLWGIIIWRYPK